MSIEFDGIRLRRCLSWTCCGSLKEDVKSLGLSSGDAQMRDKCGKQIKGTTD